MKKLIAYSSVAHMGFVTIGVFTLTMQGMQGGIFQMLSHGIVSAALFLCVGVIYDRMHTREIAAYGGLVDRMPIYAFCFMVFTLANVGLPGTSGFVGEFLTLTGRLPHQHLGGLPRHHRRDPLGGLRALPLSPHHLRQAGKAEPQIHHRPHLARGRGDDAARACSPSCSVSIPRPILDASAASVDALIKNYHASLAAAEQARLALHAVRSLETCSNRSTSTPRCRS